MTTLEFDADASRRVEAAYVTADVIEQRRIVMGMLEPAPGERVLDIGVGPGLLAAEIAAAVGPEGAVSGIDLSETMLAMAATRAERDGSARIELRIAGAEELPYPDATFDAVVSTQVFEYVPDVPRAIGEIWRVLRPGGRVLLLDSDWDSIVWRSSDNARMQHVLTLWAEHLVDPFLPRTLRDTLAHSGFDAARPVIVPIFNVGFDENTFSAILIGLVSQFVNGRGDLTPADLDAWADDLRSLGDGYFFSLNRYVFLATKPAKHALIDDGAAGDVERGGGHAAGQVGGGEDGHVPDVFEGRRPAEHAPLGGRLDDLVGAVEVRWQRLEDAVGLQRDHPDAVRPELGGQVSAQRLLCGEGDL